LTYVYKAANPVRQFFLYKFAAPRFGNARWNNGRSNRVPVVNVYDHRDPVWTLPSISTTISLGSGFLGAPAFEAYVRDPVVTTYDEAAIPTGEYNQRGFVNDVTTIAAYYHTMDASNPWFYHDRQQYRYMFCQRAWVGEDVLAHRLNFLEHNDENTWQVNFRPGRGVQGDMFVLAVPPPDDTVPSTPSVIAASQQPPPAQVVLPQNAFDFGVGGEDADWGAAQPIPARRFRLGRTRRVVD